ncbi:lipase (class 2) [Herbihabitans rhizosphaerae]|uniref:Lipase (Class 2) n=1 Tax=Herbihabitans rhizosphaerae TaxID=1872711 RepID=A0A4Q7L966_9PSEU|nr:alpha/beta fold hydrolase [Herbihabitans rhizosphaerae]RZS45231.1 lipase (class 2) [Herbihabitans rhizosphaerae]
MSRLSGLVSRGRAVIVAAGVTAALVAAGTTPAQAELREGGLPEAIAGYLATPDKVAGANDWSCKPSAKRPNPVVLLPGTFANIGANFVKASPRLKNNGYCVFATNYGMTAPSLGRAGGLDHATESAKQLDAFVKKVLDKTGAKKVDIIGHSQGGNVPIYWIKKMGNADKVAHYVGWAPSYNGTTVNGIVNLGETLGLLGFAVGLADFAQFPGVLDQTYASDYTKALWAGDGNVPSGPKYTVIMTRNDFVVTPYHTQKLTGQNVNNIVLQEKCPLDQAGHVGLFNDDPTLQMTMNALADGPANFQPRCTGFGIPLA